MENSSIGRGTERPKKTTDQTIRDLEANRLSLYSILGRILLR